MGRKKNPVRWLSARTVTPFGVAAILASTLLIGATAQARIGESEDQINARYGAPITVLASSGGESGVTKCYASDRFSIAVTYLHRKSVREIVTKKDNSKITAAEISSLLEANADGSVWNAQGLGAETNVTSGVQQWRSAHGRARVAFYDSQTHAFFITTQRFIELTNAKQLLSTRRPNNGGILERGGSQRTFDTFSRRGTLNSQQQPAATPAK